MVGTQLSLFAPEPQPRPKYRWEPFFDWMPTVGGYAQMGAVILPGQGYCYGDRVRITKIEGENVVCVVEHASDPKWWKNGKVYRCTFDDIWPNVYEYHKTKTQ